MDPRRRLPLLTTSGSMSEILISTHPRNHPRYSIKDSTEDMAVSEPFRIGHHCSSIQREYGTELKAVGTTRQQRNRIAPPLMLHVCDDVNLRANEDRGEDTAFASLGHIIAKAPSLRLISLYPIGRLQ